MSELLKPGENHYELGPEASLNLDGVSVLNSALGIKTAGVEKESDLPYRIEVGSIIGEISPYFREYLDILAKMEIGIGLDVLDNRLQVTNLEMGVNPGEIKQEFFGSSAPRKIYTGQVSLPIHLIDTHTHPSISGRLMRVKKEKPPLFATPDISFEDTLQIFHLPTYLQMIFNAAYLNSGYVPTLALVKTKESQAINYEFLKDWFNEEWGQKILVSALEKMLGPLTRQRGTSPDDRKITQDLGLGIYRGVIDLNKQTAKLTRSK